MFIDRELELDIDVEIKSVELQLFILNKLLSIDSYKSAKLSKNTFPVI
jgi:hypothetical protein